MRYIIRNNHCEGWFQGVAVDSHGEISNSSKFQTLDGARNAIRFHIKKGMWPYEVDEKPVEVCHVCGQVLPED